MFFYFVTFCFVSLKVSGSEMKETNDDPHNPRPTRHYTEL